MTSLKGFKLTDNDLKNRYKCMGTNKMTNEKNKQRI